MKAVFFDVDGTLIEGTHPDYRYMRENDKSFDELTPEEKNMFKHKHPHPL